MMQDNVGRAQQISEAIEDGIYAMMDKLCEDEMPGVKDAAFSLLVTRLCFSAGYGDCFVLPPLDEC